MTVLDTLRHQNRIIGHMVRMNLAGMTHEESLTQPQPAGNCANWVLGHILWVYSNVLPLLGEEPVMRGELEHYARGTEPITQSSQALPLESLLSSWDVAVARVDSGLSRLDSARLTHPAPNSPSGDPNETIGSLLSTVMFHQAYHSGQLGVLRRIAGREGAVK